MRWSDEETLQFVKAYVKYECLWNPEHTGYRNKYDRERAYLAISQDFNAATSRNIVIPEVKLKIKALRTTYLQNLNKVMQKSSPDNIYEPTLVWFQTMDRCLKNVLINKHKNANNYTSQELEVDSSCGTWDQDTSHNDTEDNPDPLNEDTYESNEAFVKIESLSPPSSTYKKKKKRIKHRLPSYFTETNDRESREDEFDIYGKYIASQLRQMELNKALQVQLEIQSLVSKARTSDG